MPRQPRGLVEAGSRVVTTGAVGPGAVATVNGREGKVKGPRGAATQLLRVRRSLQLERLSAVRETSLRPLGVGWVFLGWWLAALLA